MRPHVTSTFAAVTRTGIRPLALAAAISLPARLFGVWPGSITLRLTARAVRTWPVTMARAHLNTFKFAVSVTVQPGEHAITQGIEFRRCHGSVAIPVKTLECPHLHRRGSLGKTLLEFRKIDVAASIGIGLTKIPGLGLLNLRGGDDTVLIKVEAFEQALCCLSSALLAVAKSMTLVALRPSCLLPLAPAKTISLRAGNSNRGHTRGQCCHRNFLEGFHRTQLLCWCVDDCNIGSGCRRNTAQIRVKCHRLCRQGPTLQVVTSSPRLAGPSTVFLR